MSPQEDDFVIRVARYLDPSFSSRKMSLLENVFNKWGNENAKKHNQVRMIFSHEHTPQRRNSFDDYNSRKFGFTRPQKLAQTRFATLKNQRNMVSSYLYDPIHKLNDEASDNDLAAEMYAGQSFIKPHSLHTMVSPHTRSLTNGKLDQKVLDLLKRVGLGLVTISDLSLSITADMKEAILRVSGKVAPNKIGGWFNFEIVRKNIFAVAFTAEQAGFEDFTEKLFNTKLGLFNALEQTTVCYL